MSFSLSEAAVSLLTLTEHTLLTAEQPPETHVRNSQLLFMGSFDKHPAR